MSQLFQSNAQALARKTTYCAHSTCKLVHSSINDSTCGVRHKSSIFSFLVSVSPSNCITTLIWALTPASSAASRRVGHNCFRAAALFFALSMCTLNLCFMNPL